MDVELGDDLVLNPGGNEEPVEVLKNREGRGGSWVLVLAVLTMVLMTEPSKLVEKHEDLVLFCVPIVSSELCFELYTIYR